MNQSNNLIRSSEFPCCNQLKVLLASDFAFQLGREKGFSSAKLQSDSNCNIHPARVGFIHKIQEVLTVKCFQTNGPPA